MEERVMTLLVNWLDAQVKERIPGVIPVGVRSALKSYYFLNGNPEKFTIMTERGKEIKRFSLGSSIFTSEGANIVRDLLDSDLPFDDSLSYEAPHFFDTLLAK